MSELLDRARAVAVSFLRERAGQGVVPAAKALYDLAGEIAPLPRCLEQELQGGGGQLRDAARTVGALGLRGVALAPVLREALSSPEDETTPALDKDTEVAEAPWCVTAEADEAVAVLDSVFCRAGRNPWPRWSVVRASRTATLFGFAGRPLAASPPRRR
ncbi:hypothetical protein ABZ372_26215 [Streptomyces sp. NPDC005921]|uniref:hypothetical protein n=1 Tax=Streptomyces sp. NPDC005827 TaxID=3157070 RepID=UPI0033CE8044